MPPVKINLTNRSEWPTPLLDVLCRWACKRVGLGTQGEYRVLVRSCRSMSWGGRGGPNYQRFWLDTRYPRKFPHDIKDRRFQWSATHILRNRLEMLVFILAHEAAHARGQPGDPQKWREGGRCNRDSMEFRCNDAGHQAVEQLRAEFPSIRDAIRKAMAKERAGERARREAWKIRRSDPMPKLEKAQAMVDKWQRKQKAAANRVKKYLRQVRYYSGKVAAASGKK